MADPLRVLIFGLITGFLFGFFLHKGGVTKCQVIVGQFQLRDFTVLKTMLTAIVVGGIGVYVLKSLGLATLHVKPALLASVVVGGLIFGVGMVVLGYCPGTGIAAAAEGKKDAMFGVLGMLVGAAVYAELYGTAVRTINTWFDLGPMTLPQLTHAPAWLILAVLSVIAVSLFVWIDSRFKPRRQ